MFQKPDGVFRDAFGNRLFAEQLTRHQADGAGNAEQGTTAC
jgi:hypothetical protein